MKSFKRINNYNDSDIYKFKVNKFLSWKLIRIYLSITLMVAEFEFSVAYKVYVLV